MTQSAPLNIKHFLLMCPRGDSAQIDGVVAANDYPLQFDLPQSRSVMKVLPRSTADSEPASTDDSHLPSMVCGDSQDLDVGQSLFLGNGVHISKGSDDKLLIAASLTGLPCLFHYEDERCSVVADTIEAIAQLPGCSLHFDGQAIAELARIGAPINHRTLFREIKIIPAASLVTLSGDSLEIKERAWTPPARQPYASLAEYVESMAGLMQQAMQRMQLQQSFLALTAGLDTRAVLASLAQADKLVTAFTISGEDLTLDAMRAGQLCSAYGMRHHIVSINDALAEKVPEYSNLASRFSGGLNSIEQATELYFYEMAGSEFDGRLSGNLGNQIGRSGTEGTGIRNAPMTAFSREFIDQHNRLDQRHWFYQVNPEDDLLAPEFLIQRENLFAQLGNYSIGHEQMNQHTPYADRRLIEAKYHEPLADRDQPSSIKDIKMRDLKHRILGQSPLRSFQCRVVQDAGGPVATCPINWGWTTSGGFSAGGLYYGAKAFTDIAIGSKLNRVPGMTALLKAAGIKGFSSFHTRHILYSDSMQAFIRDTLSASAVRENGVFDKVRLDYLIDNGFADQSHYGEIVLALDVALAALNFSASK